MKPRRGKDFKMPCRGYMASIAHANEHTQKVFDELDAEDQEVDQIRLPLRYGRK